MDAHGLHVGHAGRLDLGLQMAAERSSQQKRSALADGLKGGAPIRIGLLRWYSAFTRMTGWGGWPLA